MTAYTQTPYTQEFWDLVEQNVSGTAPTRELVAGKLSEFICEQEGYIILGTRKQDFDGIDGHTPVSQKTVWLRTILKSTNGLCISKWENGVVAIRSDGLYLLTFTDTVNKTHEILGWIWGYEILSLPQNAFYTRDFEKHGRTTTHTLVYQSFLHTTPVPT